MIGELVGGYRLTRKLGEGGTGETYLGAHKDSALQAAVKILFPQLCADAALIDQFFSDIRVASLVNHTGIADLFDCGVLPNKRAFVIGEYLEGKTLTDALVELGQVTDVASLADIAWQVATMLGAAHEAGIVHGALKPDALFLTFPPGQAPRPLVKLVDFGMAKFKLGVRQSQTGSLLGAPLYMSPESSRGVGTVDRRADIYSLGCIMFEMLCGRPPFVRAGAGELIIAHAKEPPPFVSSLEPSVPQAIDQLIGRMLTKSSLTRPQTMAEVAAVLERFFKCPTPLAEQPRSLTPVSVQPAAGPGFSATSPAVAPTSADPVERPSSVPWVSVTAVVPSGPPATVAPAPAVRRTADPTAILQPAGQDPRVSATAILPGDEAARAAVPSPQQTWLGRVRQQTVIQSAPGETAEALSNLRPSAPMREQPSKRSTGRRSSGQPVAGAPTGAKGKGAFQSINLTVVAISAALLLVVAAVVLLGTRGSTVSTEKPKRSAARSEFVAPARASQPTADPFPSGGERAATGVTGAMAPVGDPPATTDETSTEADDDSPGGRNPQGKDKGRPRRFW
jgi:serine/threonine protein kinase